MPLQLLLLKVSMRANHQLKKVNQKPLRKSSQMLPPKLVLSSEESKLEKEFQTSKPRENLKEPTNKLNQRMRMMLNQLKKLRRTLLLKLKKLVKNLNQFKSSQKPQQRIKMLSCETELIRH